MSSSTAHTYTAAFNVPELCTVLFSWSYAELLRDKSPDKALLGANCALLAGATSCLQAKCGCHSA